MKAAPESRARERGRETAVSISGRKEPVIYTQGERGAGRRSRRKQHISTHPMFENIIALFFKKQELVHTMKICF